MIKGTQKEHSLMLYEAEGHGGQRRLEARHERPEDANQEGGHLVSLPSVPHTLPPPPPPRLLLLPTVRQFFSATSAPRLASPSRCRPCPACSPSPVPIFVCERGVWDAKSSAKQPLWPRRRQPQPCHLAWRMANTLPRSGPAPPHPRGPLLGSRCLAVAGSGSPV